MTHLQGPWPGYCSNRRRTRWSLAAPRGTACSAASACPAGVGTGVPAGAAGCRGDSRGSRGAAPGAGVSWAAPGERREAGAARAGSGGAGAPPWSPASPERGQEGHWARGAWCSNPAPPLETGAGGRSPGTGPQRGRSCCRNLACYTNTQTHKITRVLRCPFRFLPQPHINTTTTLQVGLQHRLLSLYTQASLNTQLHGHWHPSSK